MTTRLAGRAVDRPNDQVVSAGATAEWGRGMSGHVTSSRHRGRRLLSFVVTLPWRCAMAVRLEHANLTVRDVEGMIRFLKTAFPESQVRGEGTSQDGSQ